MSNITAGICVICHDAIVTDSHGWDGGHNAYPVTTGNCCEICNKDFVLPRRLRDAGFSHEAIASLPDKIRNS